MKNYIYILTIFLGIGSLNAQDVPFDKKLFKEQKDAFKEAKEHYDAGNELFEIVPQTYFDINSNDYKERVIYYREALSPLFKANKFNPNNAELNYRIGRCYLMNAVYKEEAVPHLEKALKLNPNVASDIHYHLGIAYHITMKFDKAIEAFNKYKSTLVSKNPEELVDVEKRK